MSAIPEVLYRRGAQARPMFTWDGWTCIKEDDGTTVTRYFAPQGELHSFERGSTLYQVHADGHNASVRALTDSTGAVVASYTYTAWGEVLSASEPSGFVFPYKFCGSLGVRHDNVTGLYYMRNRWYDAGLGRFLSRDPMRISNRYVYAGNRPNNKIDPLGLLECECENKEDERLIMEVLFFIIRPSSRQASEKIDALLASDWRISFLPYSKQPDKWKIGPQGAGTIPIDGLTGGYSGAYTQIGKDADWGDWSPENKIYYLSNQRTVHRVVPSSFHSE